MCVAAAPLPFHPFFGAFSCPRFRGLPAPFLVQNLRLAPTVFFVYTMLHEFLRTQIFVCSVFDVFTPDMLNFSFSPLLVLIIRISDYSRLFLLSVRIEFVPRKPLVVPITIIIRCTFKLKHSRCRG